MFVLYRYRNEVWKPTEAVFPARHSERMSKTSVRRLVKKAATAASVRPSVAGAGHGDPNDVSPHTLAIRLHSG